MIINNIPFNASLQEILDELKSQLNANGIQLLNTMKPTGNDIMVSCPYHKDGQERKPSAGIRMEDGQFHCFACGETHSLQEVISYCFGWDDMLGIKGWQWLLKNFATVSVENRKSIDIDVTRGQKETVKEYVSEKELSEYRYTHPYMWKRKLTEELVELFDIGYDKKTQCLTFPQRDILGNTLFIARRSVNTKFFNYPEDVDKPVYGLYEYTLICLAVRNCYSKETDILTYYDIDFTKWDSNEVIICESMLDALTCWAYGKYAVALNGLGTDKQFKVLNEMPCRKFILATDNDIRGQNARIRIRKALKNKLVTEYILPQHRKDMNELTKKEFENLKEVFVQNT